MIHVYKYPPPALEIETYKEFFNANRHHGKKSLPAAYDEYVRLSRAVQNANWNEWYNGYLKSKVWRAKRAVVLERVRVSAGLYRCESCLNAFPAYEIEIHHLTYDRVGREPLFDLVAVCNGCHKQLTEWSRE